MSQPQDRVRSEWRRGPEVSTVVLEELRLFRLTMIRLKPGVSADDDRSKLARYFSHPDSQCLVFRGGDGRLLGFCGLCDEAVEIEGRSVCVMTPEYFFLSPELRGTGMVTRIAARWMLGLLCRHRLRRKYAIALNYPASFMTETRTLGCLHLARDEGLSSTERALFQWFHRNRIPDAVDPVSGVTALGTIPRDVTPRSEASKRALRRYEVVNPDWRQGFAIPALTCFGRLGGGALYKAMVSLVRGRALTPARDRGFRRSSSSPGGQRTRDSAGRREG